MRVLLINPRFPKTFWSSERALALIGRKALMPPLGLLTVAALALNGPALLKRVIGLTERGAWIGLRVHDVSMEMGKTISNQGVDVQGPIAAPRSIAPGANRTNVWRVNLMMNSSSASP